MSTTQLPKYRRHANGQAFLYHKSILTKTHRLYLGPYDSPQSHRKYQQFIKRLLSSESAAVVPVGSGVTVDELILKYVDYAEGYYSRDGAPTKEYQCMVDALKPLSELFGDELGRDVCPRWLMALQTHLIGRAYARTEINKRIGRIKRFIRWGCKTGLLSADIYHHLACIEGLKRGRCDARESPPIQPVGKDVAFAVLPFVSPTVAAMIQLQYYCGMRPGEVTIVRRTDIDMKDEVWLYYPHRHKNDYRELSLVKAIPQVVRPLVTEFFKPDIEAYLFSPRDAEEWRNSQRREARVTPRQPSHAVGRRRRRRSRQIRERYDTSSYNQAIQYGIKKANKNGVEVPKWHSNQLRHAIATEVSQTLGQQAAQSSHSGSSTARVIVVQGSNQPRQQHRFQNKQAARYPQTIVRRRFVSR